MKEKERLKLIKLVRKKYPEILLYEVISYEKKFLVEIKEIRLILVTKC